MSELSMQEKLKIQKKIKEKEGKLITDAINLIEKEFDYKGQKLHIYDKIQDGNNLKEILKENQIRNVLDATLQVDCVEVIILFIQYQIGRNENWNLGGFGDSLINQINELGKNAGEIAVFSQIKADIEPIWLQLTRLYLGHLNRYFYYKKKEKE